MKWFTNRWTFTLSFLLVTSWGALVSADPPGTVGETWVGERDITETVEQIMTRQAALDAHFEEPKIQEAGIPKDDEGEDDLREDLPQDPNASDTSQFPPYNGGDVEPDNPQAVGP